MEVSQNWHEKETQQKVRLLRWAPIFLSAVLMFMVAVIAIQTFSQLRNATAWRKHTVDVILAAQSFQNNLLDMQRGMRGYVTLGDTNALESFESAAKVEPQFFNRLVELTGDNSRQQKRLRELSAAMQNVFAYDDRMIRIYRQQGSAAVVKTDLTGEGRTVFGNAHNLLVAFSDDEKKLLDIRSAAEESNYRKTERLLIIGSVFATFLIVFANIVASRELRSRRHTEKKLNRALALQDAIFNSTGYAVVSTDLNGIVKTFNPAAEQLLGYSAKEIIGRETAMLWRDPQEVAERAAALSNKLGLPIRPTFETVVAKVQFENIDEGEWTFICKDRSRFTASLVVTALTDQTGNFIGFVGFFRDISKRKSLEIEREKLIIELRDALAQVKTLSGLIPICGWCKSVRNDAGYWQTVEHYVKSRADVTFTHGMCPDCQEKFKADITRANGKALS